MSMGIFGKQKPALRNQGDNSQSIDFNILNSCMSKIHKKLASIFHNLPMTMTSLRSLQKVLGVVLFVGCAIWPMFGQASPASSPTPAVTSGSVHKTIQVGAGQWIDSGIDVLAGSTLAVAANGTIHDVKGRSLTPAGAQRGWADLMRALSANDAGLGTLIGRIGSDEASVPFVLGASKQLQVNYGGRLFLGINDVVQGTAQIQDAASKYSVDITVTSAVSAENSAQPTPDTTAQNLAQNAATPAGGAASNRREGHAVNPTLIAEAQQLLNTMPRRVTDASGGVGDMINFLIVGSQQKMIDAMQAAGWLVVDRDTKAATVHALLSTLEKKSYTEMPMSQLYLFGRTQDYGFARAEPIQVVTTRNHLRMWKTDQTLHGETVWIGAATHDIGLERDQRNGGVTHSIDPDVDKEREYLGSSLTDTGQLSGTEHILPKDPVQQAKTATGGSFHSDGRVLLLLLK